MVAAAEAGDVGIIVYNTFWTSTGVSLALVEQAGRNTQRGGPQVGHAPPRLDDLRTGGASLRPSVFRDRQSDALRGQPHAGGPGLRGPRLQLLAGVGSPIDPATEPERLPEGSGHVDPDGSTLHEAVVCRSSRSTRQATAIWTSCAWNWWACLPAAAGRPPATFERATGRTPVECSSRPGCPGSGALPEGRPAGRSERPCGSFDCGSHSGTEPARIAPNRLSEPKICTRRGNHGGSLDSQPK